MRGTKTGFIGYVRQKGITCPALHCIIHQGALCGQSIRLNETFKTVVEIIKKVRGGNRALLHRQLQAFLEEVDAEFSDLLLYNNVRWLSSGKSLERFFGIRKKISEFLKTFVKGDTSEFREKLENADFLRELAFLTDITGHLNDLNLRLQGKYHLISDLVGSIDSFQKKLKLFENALSRNDLTHFQSCKKLSEDYEEHKKPDFSDFVENLREISVEFDTRCQDFESMRPDINLFNNPLGVEVEQQEADLQMELCDLQADPFLSSRKERGPQFFKLLEADRFPKLRRFGQKITSVFGSTYLCEVIFSAMKSIKSDKRNRLADASLLHALRLAKSSEGIDIKTLVADFERPQVSH